MRDLFKRVARAQQRVGTDRAANHIFILNVLGVDNKDPAPYTAELQARHPGDLVEYLGTQPGPQGPANKWRVTIDLSKKSDEWLREMAEQKKQILAQRAAEQ